MTKRDPGHIPQTTQGGDILGLRRPPSRWAVRLALISVSVALIALALFLVSLAPWRREAVRERPEVHFDEQTATAIRPGAS